MRRTSFALAAGLAVVAATAAIPASACSNLAGITGYDSKYSLVGDPFFGGRFSNARNGSSYIARRLTKPAQIFGFYLGSAGSDVTTANSQILIKAQKTDNSWVTLLNMNEVAVNRTFSGSGSGKVVGPITENFPVLTVKAIRVEMKGNGWFLLNNLMLFVVGCS